jgi:hypothetical protein
MAVRRHFHPTNRYATLHLESAFPLGIMDSRQASSFLAGQALSTTQAPCHAELREKSRLASAAVVSYTDDIRVVVAMALQSNPGCEAPPRVVT